MDLFDYFIPVSDEFRYDDDFRRNRLGEVIQMYSEGEAPPDLSQFDIAIIGVTEDRNALANLGCGSGPDLIRGALYALHQGNFTPKIVDLGNLRNGHSPDDTYFALASVVADLVEINVLPVILGGSQDLTFAQYRAYERLGQIVNLVSVEIPKGKSPADPISVKSSCTSPITCSIFPTSVTKPTMSIRMQCNLLKTCYLMPTGLA